MERILFNAIVGPDPKRPHGPAAGSPERADAGAAARRAAAALPDWTATMSLVVRSGDASCAATLLRQHGARFTPEREGGEVRFAIENPKELSLEEHPWAIALAVQPRKADIEPVSFGRRSARPAATH